jgi:predicted ATPase with chaperone activity
MVARDAGGAIEVNGEAGGVRLADRDGAAIENERVLTVTAIDDAEIARRVAIARARQSARYGKLPPERRIRTNAEADGALLDEVAEPDAAGRTLLQRAAERLMLSARGYHRVLRVARTLADLEGAASVARHHIAEALSYRRPINVPDGAPGSGRPG